MNKRLPAEWEPQQAVLISWPHSQSYWEPILAQAEQAFTQIVNAIARFQRVIIACENRDHVLAFLNHDTAHRVECFEIPTNDCWARDFGPITMIENHRLQLLDFTFDAWGKKYEMPLDNEITQQLATLSAFGDVQIKETHFILEGGSIECDGAGTILTTNECLVEKSRNGSLNQQEIEEKLKSFFNLQRVLWLDHGMIEGDDTDGHIDTLVRFCDPNTLCYQSCDEKSYSHFNDLQAMERQLTQFKTNDDQPYRLIALPWPKPIFSQLTGDRLPASYANFLIINDAVLVPTFDDEHDELALSLLASAFPNREIIGINSLALIENFGSIHCLTMQIPTYI